MQTNSRALMHSADDPRFGSQSVGKGAGNTADLRQAARDLETVFLAEMLKSAGLGKSRDSFGGGAGEDQFSSLLIRAQAEQMTRAGGIGLAESLFNALMETENDRSIRTVSD